VENDAQDLLALSDEKRKHAMKALATLSKYVVATIKSVERYQGTVSAKMVNRRQPSSFQ
jgi:GTPase